MTDLLIIGSGPGGYQAAAYAARHGLSVTVVEESEAGGTCLNRGCIPTKSLCHDAEHPSDFAAAMARKEAVVAQLRSGVEQLMQMPGITFVRGRGVLQPDGSVHVVNPAGNGLPPVRLEGANILVATGSHAKMPPIAGIGLPGVMTSTELLSVDHVPERLCVVGAGVVGLELAGIFSAYGSQVTVVEFMKECLPQMDADLAKRLRKQMERRGIAFHMSAAVQRIEQGSDGSLSVVFEKKGRDDAVQADVVLVATGRAANIEGLAVPETLSALGIRTDRRGIVVDPDTFECRSPEDVDGATSLPRLFAIGDVNGLQMLAHAAEAQAHRVVDHILGRPDTRRFDVMPAAVFTVPELACVGATEEQLKAEGRPFAVHKATFRANGRALCIGQTEGLVKLITDPDDRLIAAHALGPQAASLVQEATAYIQLGATLRQLRETVHIHPTLSEVLVEAM